jgi:predicted TIM-barrel fold metal-dependent hydrolase
VLIADAQVHIWGANTPERPWPPAQLQPHRPEPFSKNDLLRAMDEAGVDRAIIVPPMWEGDRNDLGITAAQEHPDRLAVMGRIDIETQASEALLKDWRKQPGMLGLRMVFHRPRYRPLLEDRKLAWLWRGAEEAGVPIMVLVHPEQTHFVDEIARSHPRLKLVLDHMSLHSGVKGAGAFADLDRTLLLARHPNVAVKASALPGFADDQYPYRMVQPYLKRVIDAFGPQRVFWGTDMTRLPCTYRQAVTMITEEIPWLSEPDKAWIMGRGLCAWLGWPLRGAADESGTAR